MKRIPRRIFTAEPQRIRELEREWAIAKCAIAHCKPAMA